MTWPGLPLLVKLAGRPVILLGEGEAADAKRRLLERAGAWVVGDDPAARLAVVAIEDAAEAAAAVARLRERGVLVNAVDRPELCDFTLPAVVDRAPVLVAIATGGVSAGLAAALRQRLEAVVPSDLGQLATALAGARARLRAALPDGGERRRAIGAALAGSLDPLAPGAAGRVEGWLLGIEGAPGERELPLGGVGRPSTSSGRTDWMQMIALTSADPDDLTLRQARWLAQANRVFHTPAVPAAILDRARADAARIACVAPPVHTEAGLSVWVEMA